MMRDDTQKSFPLINQLFHVQYEWFRRPVETFLFLIKILVIADDILYKFTVHLIVP